MAVVLVAAFAAEVAFSTVGFAAALPLFRGAYGGYAGYGFGGYPYYGYGYACWVPGLYGRPIYVCY